MLSPSELLQRLAALVPPPGVHTVLFHGVLSSKAEWLAYESLGEDNVGGSITISGNAEP